MKRITLAAMLLIPAAASAVDLLTEVSSEVFLAEGMTAQQIAQRGLQCIKSTAGTSSEAVEPALDGDTAYGVIRTEYTSALLSNIAKSKISVVAKDGRFKIIHTDIVSMQSDGKYGYTELAKVWGTGWKKAEEALAVRSGEVANCVTKKQETLGGDNW